jgi:hypothetical protein
MVFVDSIDGAFQESRSVIVYLHRMNTTIPILCNGRNQEISTVNMEWGVKKVWIETATRYNIMYSDNSKIITPQ